MIKDIVDLQTLREYHAADLEANFGNRRSCAYRYLKWLRRCRYLYLKKNLACRILLKLFSQIKQHVGNKYGFDFLHSVPMGRGYHISHNIGVICMPKCAGDNLIFRNFVAIGLKDAQSGSPILGDNIQFGTGCKVLGEIKIGSHVVIGANAVVTHDVPDHSVMMGIPARVVRQTKDRWGTPMK